MPIFHLAVVRSDLPGGGVPLFVCATVRQPLPRMPLHVHVVPCRSDGLRGFFVTLLTLYLVRHSRTFTAVKAKSAFAPAGLARFKQMFIVSAAVPPVLFGKAMGTRYMVWRSGILCALGTNTLFFQFLIAFALLLVNGIRIFDTVIPVVFRFLFRAVCAKAVSGEGKGILSLAFSTTMQALQPVPHIPHILSLVCPSF